MPYPDLHDPRGLPQQSWVADPRYQHQLFPAPPPPPRAPPYSYSLDTRTRNYYPAASPRTHAAPFPPLFPPTDWTSPAEHPRHDHTRHDHHAPYPQPPYPFADPHDRDPWPSELASPASDRAPDEPLVKKKRKRADANQLRVLNATYQRTAFPSTQERESLAKELDMSPRSVQIWFQNKRQSMRQSRNAASTSIGNPIMHSAPGASHGPHAAAYSSAHTEPRPPHQSYHVLSAEAATAARRRDVTPPRESHHPLHRNRHNA